MKKKRRNINIILFIILLVILLGATAYLMAMRTIAVSTSDVLSGKNAAASEIDRYSMQEICSKNAGKVFKALKSGKTANLEKLLITPGGAGEVMEFADWSKADFDNAISLGAGSLTEKADSQGRIDVSEKYFVKAGDDRYVVFVETLTSRFGRGNEGISAVSVITYDDFDAAYFVWNGEDGKGGVTAGELIWNKETPDE